MKILFPLLAFCLFLCTCDRAQDAVPFEPYSIEWKAVEYVFSPGGGLTSTPIDNGRYLRFEDDRVYTNGSFCGLTGEVEAERSVPYDSSERTFPAEDCDNGQELTMSYTFNDDLSELIVQGWPCVEGCYVVYRRPAGE